MKKLRWFQTKVGLFQDPRMMYLLSQPHGDSYFVIWFYLKDLAGMINDDGYIYVSERQVMPTELLARQLRRRKAGDASRDRGFFDHYLTALLPLKRAWFAAKDNVDFLDTASLTPDETGAAVLEWVVRQRRAQQLP